MGLYIGNTRYCPVIGKVDSSPYDAEVEWIGVRQGAWTELSDYVPTGLGITIDLVVTFLGYPTTSNYAIWFVARTGSSYLSYRIIRGTADNKATISWANNDSNGYTVTYSFAANTTYHIYISINTLEITPINGTLSSFPMNTNHTTGTTNTSGFQIGDHGTTRGTNLNIHSFTVRDYGAVKLDYIPVRVGQVGYFYDRVSGKLYGKAAGCTTDLVVGADKN